MIEALGSFLMGMLAEYFKDKKVSYWVIFGVTALSAALLFLLYVVITFDSSKNVITKDIIATVGVGVWCGMGAVVILKIRSMYLRRKEHRGNLT